MVYLTYVELGFLSDDLFWNFIVRERLNQLTSGSTKHLPFFDCFLGVREIKDRESGKKEEICFTLFPGVRYEVIFKKKNSSNQIYSFILFWPFDGTFFEF